MSRRVAARIRPRLVTLLRAGKARHAGVGVPGVQPKGVEVALVVGTRADLSRTGFGGPCRGCEEAVFTSIQYPDDLARLCEVCFAASPDEEDVRG